ncbi:MAG: hypothetical protein AAGA42_10210 [Actinomycetota bacterium]
MTNTPITNTAAPATKKRPTDTPTAAAVDRSATRRRSSLALSLAAVGGLAVAACGGGSSNDDSGIASLDGAGDGESAADIDPELAMADYRECLADNGANIDVQVGGGGSISIGGGVEADPQAGGIGGTDPDTFSAAVDSCAELGQAAMGAFAPDPQQQAALDDAQLRFEECMDDKGLGGHVGSMMTSNAGIGVEDSAGADDPQSGGSLDDVDPDVLADALDECGAVFDELEAS